MHTTDYPKLYEKIFRTLGHLTPLRADCGALCGGACCKGDHQTGMRLFPHEQTELPVTESDGVRLAVCDGTCDRDKRPLACRIFPFFPTLSENGKVFVEADDRAARLCPMLAHSEDIAFDHRFLKAVKKVGKQLSKDPECRAFLQESTAEIDTYRSFLMEK